MLTPRFYKASSIVLVGLIALLFCPAAGAQDETAAVPPRTVIKATKYADVADVAPLLEVLDGVSVAVHPRLNYMAIRGGANLDTALRMVEALDKPEPRWAVELTIFLVAASKEKTPGSGVPTSLAPALAPLEESFGYRGFEVVHTAFLRATDSAGPARVNVPMGEHDTLHVGFGLARVIYGEPQHLVRLENLSIESAEHDISIFTNMEVREDQKVVFGTTSLRNEKRDLVLVIEAHLEDAWPPGGPTDDRKTP